MKFGLLSSKVGQEEHRAVNENMPNFARVGPPVASTQQNQRNIPDEHTLDLMLQEGFQPEDSELESWIQAASHRIEAYQYLLFHKPEKPFNVWEQILNGSLAKRVATRLFDKKVTIAVWDEAMESRNQILANTLGFSLPDMMDINRAVKVYKDKARTTTTSTTVKEEPSVYSRKPADPYILYTSPLINLESDDSDQE